MRKSHSQFTTQMRQGNSFSGKERNCAFLNLGNSQFANVSSVSGLDFIDDARGLATTDWDRDGDVDLLFANRTAPRLRYMQNEYSGNHQFVSFGLEGRESNRDGIGARVTVTQGDGNPISKTLRAGSGFLSQSSKRLTFGLGAASDNQLSLQINWPSGQSQTFNGIKPNQHYQVIEGNSDIKVLEPRETKPRLARGSIPNAGNPGTVAALCYPRMKLPITTVRFNDQAPQQLKFTSSLTLINLWASWCGPCLSELKEFSVQYDELKNNGLEIIALSTDGADGKQTTAADAASAAAKLKLPFRWGSIDRSWLEKMTLLRGELFGLQQPFPMPTSILVDQKGEMRAFYLGVVSLDQLRRDIQRLDQSDIEIRKQLTPLPGQWIAVPRTIDNLKFAGVFSDNGYPDDANQYDQLAGGQKARQFYNAALTSMANNRFQDAQSQLIEAIKLDESFAPAHLVLANLMVKLASTSQAASSTRALEFAKREYQKTLELDDDNFDALVGLGNVAARQGKVANAMESFEASLQINPDSWQVRVLLGRLYISQKKISEAMEQLTLALQSQPTNGDLAAEYGALMMQMGQYEKAITALRIADDTKPNDPKISRLFADSLLATGETKTARIKYASALANNPRDLDSRIRLAWIMATAEDENLRDSKQAVQLVQQAISAGSSDAAARQTFAAALASEGQFQQAIQQQSAAMQMLPRRSTQFNSATRRLELYQAGKPYRQKDADAIPFLPVPE